MGEIPHLRAAVSRLKGRPFEILWISVDHTREELKTFLAGQQLPGIQTWDERGAENPVANLYNARAIPRWFLLDGKGVIRAVDPFGKELVPAVEEILGQVGSQKGTSGSGG